MSKLWRLDFYFSFPVEGWSVSPASINIHHIIPINIPINVRRHSLPCPKECLTNVFLMMMDKKILASEYLPRNHCTAFKQYLAQLFTSRQVIFSQKRLCNHFGIIKQTKKIFEIFKKWITTSTGYICRGKIHRSWRLWFKPCNNLIIME